MSGSQPPGGGHGHGHGPPGTGHFDVEHSTVQFEPAGHADHEHPAHA